jgi:hypothetical protein
MIETPISPFEKTTFLKKLCFVPSRRKEANYGAIKKNLNFGHFE